MYGLKDAPRLYTDHSKKEAGKEGWKQIEESVFVKEKEGEIEGIKAMHVDDLLAFAEKPLELLDAVAARVEMAPAEEMQDGEEMGYLGLSMKQEKKQIEVNQDKYLEGIDLSNMTKKEKRRGIKRTDLEAPAAQDIEKELVPLMQRVMGIAGWVCKTQAHLAYLFGELSRWTTLPTCEKVRAAL